MRKPLVLGTAAAAVLAGALAAPASAATTGGTASTFQVNAGAISISVPTSADLGTVGTGASSLSHALGPVTVTDGRGALVATWSASAAASDFANTTTGGSSASETVAKANVFYSSGVQTAATGVGAFAPTSTLLGAGTNGLSIGTTTTVGTWAAGIGNNSATWNPTVTFNLLSSQVAGTYSGTITHSVT